MPVATQFIADVSCGELRRVGPHTLYVDSTPQAAANVGIVMGKEAILVVDARMAPRLGTDVLAAVEPLGPSPRRVYLVNTHHHGDHCFGNAAFGEAVHLASAACRERMVALWDEEVAKMSGIRPANAAEFAAIPRKLPEVTITCETTLDLGGVEAVLHPVGPAHTAGDVVVHVPADGVLFSGDLTFHGHFPFVNELDLRGLFRAFEYCAALQPRVVVPGHGSAEDAGAIDTMAELMRALLNRALDEPGPLEAAPPESFEDWLHPQRVPLAVDRFRVLLAEDPGLVALAAGAGAGAAR